MALSHLSGYHALIRKNQRTAHVLSLIRANLGLPFLFEEEELALLRMGGYAPKVEQWVREVGQLGMIRGVDFAIANGKDGIEGQVPTWLHVELGPTGNPPELEAKMDAEVREFWERNRCIYYSVKIGHP